MRDSPAEVVIPELDAAASSVGPISVGAFSVDASVHAFSLEGLQGVCLELGGRVLGRRVWRACAWRACLEGVCLEAVCLKAVRGGSLRGLTLLRVACVAFHGRLPSA